MTAHGTRTTSGTARHCTDACTRIKQPKLREAVWEVTEFDPG